MKTYFQCIFIIKSKWWFSIGVRDMSKRKNYFSFAIGKLPWPVGFFKYGIKFPRWLSKYLYLRVIPWID